MARLNPKRRRLAAQARLLQSIVQEHGKAHDDSHLLQRGSPSYTSAKVWDAQSPQNMRSIAYRSNVRADGFAPSFYKDGASTRYQGDK